MAYYLAQDLGNSVSQTAALKVGLMVCFKSDPAIKISTKGTERMIYVIDI